MALDRIIVVGKNSEIIKQARKIATQVFEADDSQDFWNITNHTEPELILYQHIDNKSALSFLEQKNEYNIDAPTIFVFDSENPSPEYEQKLLDAGVHKCINHDNNIDIKQILQEIDKEKSAQSKNEALVLKYDVDKFFSSDYPSELGIVGKSKATAKSLKLINLVAKSQCNPVLVVGETGTGKELAAKAVHIIRHGKSKPFVAINCAALTANLLESELFGHVKGAFTGAEREKTGLFEIAGNGTVFLDEISEMPLDLQAKLLRVLQEKNFRKVGGVKDINCNATIVASSNRNLLESVDEGKFRRDLYYRLAVCPVPMAPLKSPDRKQDIPLLVDYFLATTNICPEKAGKITGLTKMASEALLRHDWPGNVRELKNVIERAVLLETTDKIGLSNLMINPEHFLNDQQEDSLAANFSDFSLEKAEKELIARALRETNWQKTRAASLLGITRATLYAKVKQYNIEPPREIETPAAVSV